MRYRGMTFDTELSHWITAVLRLAGAVAIGLALHWLIIRLLCRAMRRTISKTDDIIVESTQGVLRWVVLTIAVMAVLPRIGLDSGARAVVAQILALIIPALVGWLGVSVLRAVKNVVEVRADITVADNLRARQARTRINVLYRVGLAIIAVVTVCMMLMTIPSVRNVGLTLFASAGLAGLAVGAAAQPALKNLIAGMQMAFTEPIRLDDVVIINGEWGRIEEIRLSYVVVKIWDERRLIVPVSKFLEEPFENWTRETSQLLGTAMFYTDYTIDVARVRAKLEEIVAASSLWDKRVVGLQVTDMREQTMELRALVSAADAGAAFDLRCEVREKLMAFIASEYPGALPTRRLSGADIDRQSAQDQSERGSTTSLPSA